MAFGLFPLFGLPTLLCALAAIVLRINAAAIQAVNYLVYPLQLALLAPFAQLGALIVGAGGKPVVPRVSALLHENAWRVVEVFGGFAAHAVAGWFCIALPAGLVIYFVVRRTMRRRAVVGQAVSPAEPPTAAGI